MNTIVIYYSQFGNTRKLAEEFAETAAQVGQARAVNLGEFTPTDLEDAGLVLMGSPTHYQNLPKIYREVLEALPRRVLAGKSVAAFDTSVEAWGPLMRMTAAHRLLRKLRKLGGKPAAKAETFLVKQRDREDEGEQDLLYDGEIERSRVWAAGVLEKLGEAES